MGGRSTKRRGAALKGQPPGPGEDNGRSCLAKARVGVLAQHGDRDSSRGLGIFLEEAARGAGVPPFKYVCPLSGYDPAGSSPTAGNADRAVLYDFRRFPAGIQTFGDPLIQRDFDWFRVHRKGRWDLQP